MTQAIAPLMISIVRTSQQCFMDQPQSTAFSFSLLYLVSVFLLIFTLGVNIDWRWCLTRIISVFFFSQIVFQDAPRYPPSPAQAAILQEAATTTYLNWIKALVKNWNFIILVISYGINVGAFYGISTLLNQCILFYFPVNTVAFSYVDFWSALGWLLIFCVFVLFRMRMKMPDVLV